MLSTRHNTFPSLLMVALLSQSAFLSQSLNAQAQFSLTAADLSSYNAVYPNLPVDELIRQAIDGNVLAQHELSNRLAQGNGITRNSAAAAYWYSLSASRGYPGSPSLDKLPNFPNLARGATSVSLANPPTASFTINQDNNALSIDLDASASTVASSISRYIWWITNADGSRSDIMVGNVESAQVTFSESGIYYATLAILDSEGRIAHTTEQLELQVDPITESPPSIPIPLEPIAGALVETNIAATFSWQPAAYATGYDIDIAGETSILASLDAGDCADIICSLAVNFAFPANQDVIWRVRSTNSVGTSDWAESTFRTIDSPSQIPSAPIPLSPITDSLITQNEVIDFTWVQDPHAITYEFHFFDATTTEDLPVLADLRSNDICADEQCVVTLPVNLPMGENHAWLVRGRNSLGTSDWSLDTFSVIEPITDIPGAFVLTAPVDNAQMHENTEITFIWTRATQASQYEFAIVDGTDINAELDTATISDSTCEMNSCSFTTSPSLPVSDLHSWQVRAVNSIGKTPWISSAFTIITEPVEPAAALIPIAPLADSPVLAGQSVNFQWEHNPQAQLYEFYINDADNELQAITSFLLPVEHCIDDVCSYSQEVSLLPGTLHSWHVRAQFIDNDSLWADTMFTVLPGTSNEPESVHVLENNVSGGGFQGDVTITDDGLTIYSSADNSGVIKSTDGGLLFHTFNQGLQSTKVASLAITEDNDQTLYAGTGDKGNSGGLFRSIDGGDTWAITGDGITARFAGNHSASIDPVPTGHPRSNGNLIVVDHGDNPASYTDDIVIAGSYKDGVRLFAQGGENEASAVNTAGFVRSVARHPNIPGIALAAIQFANNTNNGIYRIDYSDLANPISTLEFSALQPEGVTVLSNGHVYAAIGSAGIVKYDGTSWAIQSAQLAIDNPNRQWTAVDGYVSSDQDIVYAGVNNVGGTAEGMAYSSIWRTVDGAQSWSELVDFSVNVSDTVYGKTYDWWFRVEAFGEAGLGRRNSIVSSIDVARGSSDELVSDDIVYVSGRGGIWKSDNGGNSWAPTVFNLQATSHSGVAVNPNNPGQVVLANTDYVLLQTRTGFEGSDISRDKPIGSKSRSHDVIFDTVSNEVILGVGNRDSNDPGSGEVYVKSASALGAPSDSGWTNTNLRSATPANDGRVRAVAYGYHNGTTTTTQTLLAAVEGEGVYRYYNGTWTKSTGVVIGSTNRSNLVWPNSTNSGVVYLLDLSSGLHRSPDGGQSWENIWPVMSLRNNDFYTTGFIAAIDSDPTTLYLSIQGNSGSPIGTQFRVFRMIGADVGIFGEPGTTDITNITNHSDGETLIRPGPLAFDPHGNLWLTEQQDTRNAVYAGLYVMENPTVDTSFTNMTSNDYRNAVVAPTGIDISSNGHVYVTQNGGGVVKLEVPCRLYNSCQ